ncbi:hypothetical protein ACOARS_13450, partial [Glaesserella parasuis]|uniref:hypothetical protein n=1 Tax=Glaesserella parasuis TaxID=738 RepID=UPI003B7EE82E
GVGLEGTVWQYYRLRGTLSELQPGQQPQLLANSELEAGFQTASSCNSCHSHAAVDFVWSLSKARPLRQVRSSP